MQSTITMFSIRCPPLITGSLEQFHFFQRPSCVLSKPKDLRIESVCSPRGAGPLGLTSDVANLIGILTVVYWPIEGCLISGNIPSSSAWGS